MTVLLFIAALLCLVAGIALVFGLWVESADQDRDE